MSEDGWNDGFRSPSPDLEMDDDGPVDFNALSTGGNLMQELDLSNRYETVTYKETPFTIAAQRGGRTEKKNSRKPALQNGWTEGFYGQHAPSTRGESSSKYNNKNRNKSTVSSKPQPESGLFKTIRNNDKDNAPAGDDEPPVMKVRSSGWVTASDEPIPKDPPRKKSILDKQDDWMSADEKRRLRNQKAAATRARNKKKKEEKKKREEEEKEKDQQKREEGVIKFGIISPHAKPETNHPILKGIEKMKDLPIKSKNTKGKGKKGKIEEEQSVERLGVEALHNLICGNPEETSKATQQKLEEIATERPLSPRAISKKERKMTLEEIIDNNSKNTSSAFKNNGRNFWDRSTPGSKKTMNPNINKDQSPIIDLTRDGSMQAPPTPPNDNDEVISVDQPSTITRLPSSALHVIEEAGDWSSRATPSISPPLERYNKDMVDLIAPKPVTAKHNNKAGRLPNQLETPKSSTIYQRTSDPSPTPAISSSKSNEAMFSRNKQTFGLSADEGDDQNHHARGGGEEEEEEEEWSTLPKKGYQKNQNRNRKRPNVFNSDHRYGRNKFRKHINLFPKKTILIPEEKDRHKITDHLTSTANPSPFANAFLKLNGQRKNEDFLTKIDKDIDHTGNSGDNLKGKGYKITLFTPKPPSEDKVDPKSILTLKTIKGDKYGSSISSNTLTQSQSEYHGFHDGVNYQGQHQVQNNRHPQYPDSIQGNNNGFMNPQSNLGPSHSRVIRNISSNHTHGISNRNQSFHTNGFTNHHNFSNNNPQSVSNPYSHLQNQQQPQFDFMPMSSNDTFLPRWEEEKEDWTKAWSRAAHHKVN
ncbi:uncharacterized protein L201_002945 [Kwoniella dendrophila CBS 6074]|uniref:BZIP domain-containing protein n=1 Tax=Kwoniella dendrophila CBS 6074 TaxID=1295534 RepID=A0AAX4JRG8_9TREE